MKVRVTLTVEVDEKAWADTYGIMSSEVRDDVKCYVATVIADGNGAADEGLIKSVQER